MSGLPFELRAELLDDFFAECDEQLSAVRAQLAAHEKEFSGAGVSAAALETIYRNIHSLKGNAAIVGLAAAEELAHAMEGLLRRLTRREVPLDAALYDLLAQGTHRLQQLIEAFRAHQPLPAVHDLAVRLAPYTAGPAAPGEAVPAAAANRAGPGDATPASHADTAGSPRALSEDAASTSHPSPRGARPGEQDEGVAAPGLPVGGGGASAAAARPRWRATFEPTAELDARGVNINSVRRRLSALGDIVAAVPEVKPGGLVRFVFTLAVRQPPANPATWRADGVDLTPETPGAEAHDGAAATATGAASPEPAGASATDAEPAGRALPSHMVRVELSRLDELMRIAGEMVIQRSRLQQHAGLLGPAGEPLREVDVALGRSLRDLRAAIVRVRLVPVHEIFSRLPFVVRDLARDSGKKVRVELEGQDTEVDKYIVERMKEPLLHLVRNAISHGIESPADRQAAGKPEQATLLLRASASGDAVRIEVRDDGRGIDAQQVAARARTSGIEIPELLAHADVLRLICTPGFSTREQADRVAGRGVGMAVVDTAVRDLGGTLALTTEPRQFTQFTLRLPLTLAIIEALIVSAGVQTCAVPRGCLEEIVSVPAADLRTIHQAEVCRYRGALLPVFRLRTFFGEAPGEQPELPVLVIATEAGLTGLVVDRVRGQREVVVRPIRDPLVRVPGVTGATELGDGRPVLILDAPAVAARAGALRRETATAGERPGSASPTPTESPLPAAVP